MEAAIGKLRNSDDKWGAGEAAARREHRRRRRPFVVARIIPAERAHAHRSTVLRSERPSEPPIEKNMAALHGASRRRCGRRQARPGAKVALSAGYDGIREYRRVAAERQRQLCSQEGAIANTLTRLVATNSDAENRSALEE